MGYLLILGVLFVGVLIGYFVDALTYNATSEQNIKTDKMDFDSHLVTSDPFYGDGGFL